MAALAATNTQPTLDVQVLQGLETYIQTEKFLHTLEAASAEWIDLSDHQQQHVHKGWSPPASVSGLELMQMKQGQMQHSGDQQQQQQPPEASTATKEPTTSGTSRSSSFFGLWRRSGSGNGSSAASSSTQTPDPSAGTTSSSTPSPPAAGAAAAGSGSTNSATSSSSQAVSGCDAPSSSPLSPAVAGTSTSTFELVEPQSALTESIMQEPFVLVSSEDAIEGMAYYIALYLSRAPEARNMEPKQLQAALRRTMTAIRRSRYRAIWDWGRCLYRWGAVSYSALQLYEHPWLVRAVVAGVWASSKMAFGVLL